VAQHPCGETLKRAFGFVGDEKANVMESKIKLLRLSGVKEQIRRVDLKKVVLYKLIGLTTYTSQWSCYLRISWYSILPKLLCFCLIYECLICPH
jgi:hypothetical protein